MYQGLFGALAVAFILTCVIVAVGRRGPWGTAWTFFLVLFLALWIVSLYVRAVGPVYYGIAWLPIVIAGLLLTLLLIAVVPDANNRKNESVQGDLTIDQRSDINNSGVGRFFWVLIVLMVAAIVVGMMNPQPAL
jgi:hypothetical protein